MPAKSAKAVTKVKPVGMSRAKARLPAKTASKPATKLASKKRHNTSATSSKLKAPTAKASSKQAQLIDMLRSEKGGTLEQMIKLTGWQPHTVRGTLSGVLRKRLGLIVQHAVALDTGTRVYRIVEPAAA